jgi:hypothetical protein
MPWFNKGCSQLLQQRKQGKFKWLQDPNKMNIWKKKLMSLQQPVRTRTSETCTEEWGDDKIAIAKLKKYKPSGSDHILAVLIQAGGEILLPVIHKLMNYLE